MRPINRITCAIHQPNLFPRLSTLAKLYAADIWVVLNDVQFNARDYQHRARLVAIEDTQQQQWLTLPAHKPFGRATRINEISLLEQQKSARRVVQLAQQHYGRAPYWPTLAPLVQTVAAAISSSGRLADVAELSTRLLLGLLGWRGLVVRSSDLVVSSDRSARLADLAVSVGALEYLCGTGGAKYLDEAPFLARGIGVRYLRLPEHAELRLGNRVSALYWLATTERTAVRDAVQ